MIDLRYVKKLVELLDGSSVDSIEIASDKGLKIRPMVLPDRFQDQDSPEKMYAAAGLDAKSIVATALAALGRPQEANDALRA